MSNIEKIKINGHYVWVDKDTQIKDVRPYIGRWHLESGQILNKLPTYLTDLSECKLIIAASPELNLEEVPTYVEWLSYQNYPFNPELTLATAFIKGYQTAEKELPTWDDVRKAIELTRSLYLEDSLKASMLRIDKIEKIQEEILEQLFIRKH